MRETALLGWIFDVLGVGDAFYVAKNVYAFVGLAVELVGDIVVGVNGGDFLEFGGVLGMFFVELVVLGIFVDVVSGVPILWRPIEVARGVGLFSAFHRGVRSVL